MLIGGDSRIAEFRETQRTGGGATSRRRKVTSVEVV
jgi:hypothetical protein